MGRRKLETTERVARRQATVLRHAAKKKASSVLPGVKIIGPRGEQARLVDETLTAKQVEVVCKKRYNCTGILVKFIGDDEILLGESSRVEAGIYGYVPPTPADGPPIHRCDRCASKDLDCRGSPLMPEACYFCIIHRVLCKRDGTPETPHEYVFVPTPKVRDGKLVITNARAPPVDPTSKPPDPMGTVRGAIAVRRGQQHLQLRVWVESESKNFVVLASRLKIHLVLTFLIRKEAVKEADVAVLAEFANRFTADRKLKAIIAEMSPNVWLLPPEPKPLEPGAAAAAIADDIQPLAVAEPAEEPSSSEDAADSSEGSEKDSQSEDSSDRTSDSDSDDSRESFAPPPPAVQRRRLVPKKK